MKNKKGKKLVVLGAMAALLTLIGVSGSQTYAKYIETAQVPAQQATVAKWGFVLTANNEDVLFGKEHTVVEDMSDDETIDGSGVSVVSSSSDNKVAPGTTGSLAFSITGSAEVKAQILFNFTKTAGDISLTNGSKTYYPLKWSLKKNGVEQLANGLLSEVETELDKSYTINANQSLETNYSYVLSYKWAFNGTADSDFVKDDMGNSDPADDVYYTYDELDTILGKEMASIDVAGFTAVTSVGFSFNFTVQQVA